MMGMPEVVSTTLCVAIPCKACYLCCCNANTAHGLKSSSQIPRGAKRAVHASPNTACMLR